jgi:hypothetical protein
MRRCAPLVLCLALVAAACSDSDDSSDTTAAPDTTTVVETTEPAPETTSEPEATAEPVSITPEVLCQGEFDEFRTYFAYVSDSADAVAVPADQSVLDGLSDGDNPFVPTLFAPGRVSPAFFAYGGDELSWTIVSPDGSTQTASPAADTPECTDELLTPTTPDPRTPELEVTSSTLAADGGSVTIELTLSGVPELSVCHPAFTSEPVAVVLEEKLSGTRTEGTTATFTADIADDTASSVPTAKFFIQTSVVDRCTADGTTQNSWPSGGFEDLWQCLQVRATVADGDVTVGSNTGNCFDLPATGGAKSRPG